MIYQIENYSDGKKCIHFSKNPALGFDFDFDIYLPLNIRENANLLLSFCDKFEADRTELMLDAIQAPVMITHIENGIDEQGNIINYKQFEKESLVRENGNKVKYGSLDTSIIEQYKIAISEAYKALKQMEIIDEEKEEKIDVEGYSAQGVKAQRLSFLIPESIRSATVGGAISSMPLPLEELNGIELPYPDGIGGLNEIIGNENAEKWKENYKKLIQIAYATEQELKYDGNFTIDGERIIRNSDLTKSETSYSQISVSQHDVSPDVAKTVKTQVLLWGSDINERISKARETINLNGGNLKKIKIYKGISHHFMERGEDGPKEFLADLSDAIVSMDEGKNVRGFERWRRKN